MKDLALHLIVVFLLTDILNTHFSVMDLRIFCFFPFVSYCVTTKGGHAWSQSNAV